MKTDNPKQNHLYIQRMLNTKAKMCEMENSHVWLQVTNWKTFQFYSRNDSLLLNFVNKSETHILWSNQF